MFIIAPIDAFVNLLKENIKNEMIVAEIGVFDGSTTRESLTVVGENNGTYYAIDWFRGTMHPGWEDTDAPHSYKPDKDIYDQFMENMSDHKYFNNLTTIKATSEEAATLFEDEFFDICFIDADHSYKAVKRDIELFLPKVKSGGILCGHDVDDINFSIIDKKYTDEELAADTVNNVHIGTIMAVYEAFGKVEVRKCKNNVAPIWIYRKP